MEDKSRNAIVEEKFEQATNQIGAVAAKFINDIVMEAVAGNFTELVDKLKRATVAFTGADASLLDNVSVQIAIVTFLTLLLLSYSKIMLWARGIVFLFLSNESKGLSKAQDSNDVRPLKIAGKAQAEMESKIIIFIRHGESDWNYIFNKNKLLLLPRLVIGLLKETFMFRNSLFIDSPLSAEGVAQAKQLQTAITNNQGANTLADTQEILKALRGDEDAQPSVVVSSNLRRAVSTGCIALWPRLRKTQKKITILPSLQEMSRNVDTNALAGKKEIPDAGVVEQACPGFIAKKFLDASQSGGNKALRSRALPRMEEFCGWCFKQSEPIIIVSSGHSLWYKNFFKAFIPKRAKGHHATTHKMVNCGVVAFKLEKGSNLYDPKKPYYKVDEKSVLTVYGGFEKLQQEKPRSSETMFVPRKEEQPEEQTQGTTFQTAKRLSRRASEIFVGPGKTDTASPSVPNGIAGRPPPIETRTTIVEAPEKKGDDCGCAVL